MKLNEDLNIDKLYSVAIAAVNDLNAIPRKDLSRNTGEKVIPRKVFPGKH